jgi:hypothetical protein
VDSKIVVRQEATVAALEITILPEAMAAVEQTEGIVVVVVIAKTEVVVGATVAAEQTERIMVVVVIAKTEVVMGATVAVAVAGIVVREFTRNLPIIDFFTQVERSLDTAC